MSDVPVVAFEQEDRDLLFAWWYVAVAFGWDVFGLVANDGLRVMANHDGDCSIASRKAGTIAAMREILTGPSQIE